MIYSDDGDIAQLAEGRFEVIKIKGMPLPPEDSQTSLRFEAEPDEDGVRE